MSESDARLRPHPAERFAGTEHVLDLDGSLRALRAEAWPSVSGHRQIALMHQGPVRLVLFAFHAGGTIKEHSAQGWVTIQCLHGTLVVRTHAAVHRLTSGILLSLAPGAFHEVEAEDEADMLLGIYPDASG